MRAIERLSAEFWPGIPVVPAMSAGATDGSYLRNAGIPTYGHSVRDGSDSIEVLVSELSNMDKNYRLASWKR